MRIRIKVLFFFIVAFLISSSIFAGKKKEFGIKGGLNLSTTLVSLSDYASDQYLVNDTEYKYNVGFNAGFFMNITLSERLSFQPEIVLTVKGMRNESIVSQQRPPTTGYYSRDFQTRSKTASYYIEIPLYLKTSFEIVQPGKIIAGIGPFFAYGIGGKMQVQLKSTTPPDYWKGSKQIFKEDEIGFSESTFVNDGTSGYYAERYIREPYWHKSIKRLDGGISGFVGYDFQNNLFLTTGCDLGLINILNPAEAVDGDVTGRMHNFTFTYSLGYKF